MTITRLTHLLSVRPVARALCAAALAAALAAAAGAQDQPTLAFLGEREGRVEVYVWRVGDAEARRLTDIGAPWGANVQWAPDGRRLCVMLDREAMGVWVVDAVSGEATRLTPPNVWAGQPCWDASGDHLYLSAGVVWPPGGPEFRSSAALPPDSPELGRIYRVAASGGELTPITGPGRYADLTPAPGGGIIFAQDMMDGTSRIVQVDAQGAEVRTWEPRPGEWLGAPAAHGQALAADRLVGWDCSVVIHGPTPRTFTLGERLMWFPVWSPDGGRLLVESVVDGRRTILALEMESGEVRAWRLAHVLFRPAANEWYPQWSPDGRLVAFSSDRGGAWVIRIANAEGRLVGRVPGEFTRAYGGVFRPAGDQR